VAAQVVASRAVLSSTELVSLAVVLHRRAASVAIPYSHRQSIETVSDDRPLTNIVQH
jgi:hypothetical protein